MIREPGASNSITFRRSVEDRERDLVDIGKLYAEGRPIYAIAAWLSENRDYKVSSSVVSNDIRVLRDMGTKALARPLIVLRQQECMKIDRVEQEAWEAWYRSLREKTKKQTAMEIEGDDGADERNPKGKPSRVTRMLRVEESWGDPRYLQIIQWCIDRRCKLLGLDAPQKVETDITLRQMAQEVAEIEGLNPDDVLAQAQSIFAATKGFN